MKVEPSQQASEVDASLSLSCLCGKSHATFTIPKILLPLQTGLCHCNTCRHQTGELASSTIVIPNSRGQTSHIEGPLASYEASDLLTRYFCTFCGANIHVVDSTERTIEINVGVLDSLDNLSLHHHSYLSDTRDGGLSVWLPDIISWSHSPGTSTKADRSTFSPKKDQQLPTIQAKEGPCNLSCHCHCGTISFHIAPPPLDTSAFPQSFRPGPYSDLLIPHHTPNPHKTNPENEPWCLRRTSSPRTEGENKSRTRYLAGLCTCRSCRKASGNIFQAWAFVPRHLILSSNTNGVLNIDKLRADDGGGARLKTYVSSGGTCWDFCSRCGATVFLRKDVRDVVDVSVGLMDAKEGVRAESWLDWWTERVSFEEEAEGEGVLGLVKEGMRRWEERKGGEGE